MSLTGAAPAFADRLVAGEAATTWAPSFSFLASQASAPGGAVAAPETSRAAPASTGPLCTSAVSDDCITTVSQEPAVATVSQEPAGHDPTASPAATPSDPGRYPSTATTTRPGTVILATSHLDPGAPAPPDPSNGSAAAAPPQPRDESELWVPSLSFFGAALIQDADSAVESRPLYDPLNVNAIAQDELCLPDDPIDCIRPSASGSDRQVTPLVAASLEVMSPAIQSWFGRPRAFAHFDAGVSFSRTRNIARDGTPGRVGPPPEFVDSGPGLPVAEIAPVNVNGQGSQTSSWVKSLILNGGLGVAFTADVADRRIRIKPSVEYLSEWVQVDGVAKRVAATVPPPPGETPTCKTTALEECRVISLSGSDDQMFQGVGPGLEVEMDAARAGPIILSVYTAGAAYRMLGDLDIDFSETVLAVPDDPDSGETGRWHYEKDPWSYRVGVGLRFRFAPED